MKITYKPEGGSQQVWDVDMENPPWDVTFATEKATGWPWLEFTEEKLAKGSVIALQALVWALRKRSEPNLRLEAVQPRWGEVDVEDDTPEPSGDVEAAEEAPRHAGQEPGEA